MKNIDFKIISNKIAKYIAILFLTFLAFNANAQANKDSKGNDFWLTFNENFSGQAFFYISGDENTSGTVSVPSLGINQNFIVTAGQVTTITLPTSVFLTVSGAIENKGIHVTSTKEITVYGMNLRPFTTDAYLGLPTDALGLEYLVMSYAGVGGSQIGIVGTEDATVVSFKLPVSSNGFVAGTTYTKTLNKGQTFYLKNNSNTDFTGAVITSTKPVAVFTGNQCTNVPATAFACDHLVEQMPPTSGWGKNFVSVPLKTRRGDTFRFLAGTDNTVVSVNGLQVATLNRGQFFEKIYEPSLNITSSEPILVAQYANGSTYDGANADPFMMLISPFEQFLGSYTVTTPSSGFAFNFANIVTSNAAVGTIKLDGVIIPASLFSQIGTSGFSGAQVNISIGSHTLTSSGLPFGASVYGFNNFDSYGYPGGASYSPIATVNSLTLTPKSGSSSITTSACFTATVLDQFEKPVKGVRVDFAITGVNSASSGFANTDSLGVATFCYTGVFEGEDMIKASVGTFNDNGSYTWKPLEKAPEITCPENITVNSLSDQCGANVNFAATETVGIPVSNITYSHAPGGFFPVGTTTVTATATNSVGSSVCTFTVTVKDATAPIITAPVSLTVNNDLNNCGAVVNYVKPTATDNCSLVTSANVVHVLNRGQQFFDFANNRFETQNSPGLPLTFMPTDGQKMAVFLQNNSSTHYLYQNVTLPATGPILLTYDLKYTNHAGSFHSGQFIAVQIRNASTDALLKTVFRTNPGAPVSTPMTSYSFDISEFAGQNVRLQIIDATINSFFFDVLLDNVKITGSTLVNGSFESDYTGWNAFSTSSSGGTWGIGYGPGTSIVQTAGLASGSNFPVGSTVNTFKATDASGNVTEKSFTVTVKDTQLPTAIAQNLTVDLVNGSATITPAQINNGSSDNCGIASITLDKSSFDCSSIGANTVTLTVTDASGNFSTATAVVTVVGETTTSSITSVPTSSVNTGGNPNNLFLGYGAQSTTLQVSNLAGGNGVDPRSYTYEWTGNGLSSTTSGSPVFTPTTAGYYNFNVIVTNKYGCKSTASISICVRDIREVDKKGNFTGKVYLTHYPSNDLSKGNTLSISVNAVPSHLNHGIDRLGSVSDVPCDSSTGTLATNSVGGNSTENNVSISNLNVNSTEMLAYPNPFGKVTTVRFILPYQEDKATLDIYDLKGTKIQNLFNGNANAQTTYEVQFNGQNLSAGTYFFRLITAKEVKNFKVIMSE